MPAPSFPTITAIGPSTLSSPPFPRPPASARRSGTPSAAAAHRVTPCWRAHAMNAVSSNATTGCRNVAPIAARADFLDGHGVPPQLRDEGGAARGAGEVGRDQRAAERDSRRQRLLDEPDALDQGEPTPPARLAALKIADRRLQITGYGLLALCRRPGLQYAKDRVTGAT